MYKFLTLGIFWLKLIEFDMNKCLEMVKIVMYKVVEKSNIIETKR